MLSKVIKNNLNLGTIFTIEIKSTNKSKELLIGQFVGLEFDYFVFQEETTNFINYIPLCRLLKIIDKN